tara:strand:- start:817 stop:1767 length:951 start_codon:yes stop_codon:yes gene_type:complete
MSIIWPQTPKGKWIGGFAIALLLILYVFRTKFGLTQLLPSFHNVIVVLILLGLFLTSWATLRKGGETFRDIRRVLGAFGILFFMGLILVTSVADFVPDETKESAFRSAALWALAFLLSGFFVGFLFGIPRVLQSSGPLPEDSGSNGSSGYNQQVNTNLEQISDWLTKIIVGVGLVELRSIPGLIDRLSIWVAGSWTVDSSVSSELLASLSGSIILFFSILGFLGGYLTTRLFLAGAFGRADKQATSQILVSSNSGDSGDQIRNFWKPDNTENSVNAAKITEWMKENGLEDVLITDLTRDKDLGDQRQKLIADLGLT